MSHQRQEVLRAPFERNSGGFKWDSEKWSKFESRSRFFSLIFEAKKVFVSLRINLTERLTILLKKNSSEKPNCAKLDVRTQKTSGSLWNNFLVLNFVALFAKTKDF